MYKKDTILCVSCQCTFSGPLNASLKVFTGSDSFFLYNGQDYARIGAEKLGCQPITKLL